MTFRLTNTFRVNAENKTGVPGFSVISNYRNLTLPTFGSPGFKIFDNYGGIISNLGQLTEIIAHDGMPNDAFGFCVAIYGTAVGAGAYNKMVGSNDDQGAAYIYTTTGNYVTQMTAADGMADDNFGNSIAMFGTDVVIGADGRNNSQGAVYIYSVGGTFLTEITAHDGVMTDGFGSSVAIYNTNVVIGAPYKNSDKGTVYIYTTGGALLTEITTNVAEEFGFSVAVSNDVAVIGAPTATVGSNNNQGAVYIYSIGGTLLTEITAPDGATNDFFGFSVVVYNDIIAISAPFKNVGLNGSQGVVYVYSTSGTLLTEIIAADGSSNDFFGMGLAINQSTIAIGASGKNNAQGAVYIYTTGGILIKELMDVNANNTELFGHSVAIYNNVVVIGAPGKNSHQGAIFFANV